MRLILTASLALTLTGSAWAQHGGSGSHSVGGASHMSAGFSSNRSFSPPAAPRVFAGTSANRPGSQARPYSYQYNSPTGPAPFGGTSPSHNHGGRPPYSGNGYRPYYSRGVYLVPGWLNYGYSYIGDYGYPNDQAPSADANAQAMPPDAGDQEAYAPAPPRPTYQPEGSPAAEVQDQPEVTLLFKDGRPPQQVTNYAVTQTTLYVLDGSRRREIPLDQIDLPQTVRANRAAGVDFEVPVAVD